MNSLIFLKFTIMIYLSYAFALGLRFTISISFFSLEIHDHRFVKQTWQPLRSRQVRPTVLGSTTVVTRTTLEQLLKLQRDLKFYRNLELRVRLSPRK